MTTFSIMKKNWKLPLIAGAGIIFALISVLSRPAAEEHKPLIMPPSSTFDRTIAGIGVIEPSSEIISIGTELSGVVREVDVKVGDNVQKSAPLFSLDQRDIDAQIAILESSHEVAKAQLADAEAQYAIVSGIKDKRAVAKDDYNRRKYARQIATARIQEIQAQINQAKTTKERMNVKAPIPGQILEVNIRPGEYANIGNLLNPLMIMGDMETTHVRVEIDEESAASIQPESPAKAAIRGRPNDLFPLKFVRFEPYVRPKQNLATAGQRVDTRVLRIIYALPKSEKRFFAGQQMDIYIEESGETK